MNKTELKETVLARLFTIEEEPKLPETIENCFDELYEKGFNTLNIWAMFLSQCSHESVDFTVDEENLN